MSDESTRTISGIFENRDLADSVVERLVQEYGVKRTDIFVVAHNPSNSAGDTVFSGGDAGKKAAELSPPLRGPIKVSADLSSADIPAAEGTFRQFGANEILLD